MKIYVKYGKYKTKMNIVIEKESPIQDIKISNLTNHILKVYQKGTKITSVIIDDKQLILPISNREKIYKFSLNNSIYLELSKISDSILKLHEIDDNSSFDYYINIFNTVYNLYYDSYNYLPMDLSEEEVKKKLVSLKEILDFKPDIICYNKHGLGVFGFDDKDYVFYYASPTDSNLNKLKTLQILRYRDGGTSIALSSPGYVNFRYNSNLSSDGKCYLNSEEAKQLNIPQLNI